jgi:signal transduction histidine kinase
VTPSDIDSGYRALFDENPQPMWVCHRKSRRLLTANAAALALYGYSIKELTELEWPQLVEGGAGIDPALPGDQLSAGPQVKKDRATFAARLVWHPCEFQGEPAHLVLVQGEAEESACRERLADLERQAAERVATLEVAQHELETFSYSVSHDLQAPLRHIDGFSRALLDDYGEVLDPKAQEYLLRITQAAGRMASLIDALQQLSRVARAELSRQPVNLSVKAQVVALELKRSAPDRNVEFSIEEEVQGNADAKLVRQLLEILIGNAWKFTSTTDPARIEFGTRPIDGQTAYFVKDNGVGFDMAYAEKLFTTFHRLHRSDEFPGSGVGLSIAHRIVTRHGGRIWADSAPGQGATFFFTL